MNKQRKKSRPVLLLSILILVLVVLFSGLQALESTVLDSKRVEQPLRTSKTVTRDGVDYFPRQDITVLLIMGIDEIGPVKDSGSYNNEGEADVVMLGVFNDSEKTYSILTLNRDTMMDVSVLGLGGKYAGTHFEQLALSHTYGSGLKDSCENTKETVSRFLNNIQIDYYLAMNIDGIGVLNDAIGGVTVNITDDFSSIDPALVQGTVTLQGDQAINYLRSRSGLGDQLNISRMQRHKTYMQGFAAAFQNKARESDDFVLSTFNKLSPYIVTDASVNVISSLLERYAEYTLAEIVSPEGENVLQNKYYEFHVNQDKLEELVLELFYAPK